jgi:hypothetical protein
VGVEINSQVTATFSAPVSTATVSKETFSVKDVEGNITSSDDHTTIIFTPVPSFKPGKKYTVTIKESIMDTSGATMSADKVWSFTTKQN